MSYKYHERAIVINERNLIRVFDVLGYDLGNLNRWQGVLGSPNSAQADQAE